MTPEEINIAIAEVLGKTTCRQAPDLDPFMVAVDDYSWDFIGNYHGDLNAMHEAEKTLNHGQQWDYMQQIALLSDFEAGSMGWSQRHASSRILSEAFLRTLNLWRE